MSDSALLDLYREQVLHHSREPCHFRRQDNADYHVNANNPLCGDRLDIYISMQEDRVSDVSFEGSGCAISVASASMMSEMLSDQPRAAAIETIDRVQKMLHQTPDSSVDENLTMAPIAALSAVRQYPSRVKCAALAWRAAAGALTNNTQSVSTE